MARYTAATTVTSCAFCQHSGGGRTRARACCGYRCAARASLAPGCCPPPAHAPRIAACRTAPQTSLRPRQARRYTDGKMTREGACDLVNSVLNISSQSAQESANSNSMLNLSHWYPKARHDDSPLSSFPVRALGVGRGYGTRRSCAQSSRRSTCPRPGSPG